MKNPPKSFFFGDFLSIYFVISLISFYNPMFVPM